MNIRTAEGFRDGLKVASVFASGMRTVGNFARRNVHGLTGMGVRDAAHAASIGLDPKHFQLGLTSVPGTARALMGHNPEVGSALGAVMRGNGSKLNLAMNAIPVAAEVPSLLRGDESAVGGKSMTGKLVGLGANVGLGIASGGLPVATNALTGLAAAPVVDALTRRL
jgi:hypothetical protein